MDIKRKVEEGLITLEGFLADEKQNSPIQTPKERPYPSPFQPENKLPSPSQQSQSNLSSPSQHSQSSSSSSQLQAENKSSSPSHQAQGKWFSPQLSPQNKLSSPKLSPKIPPQLDMDVLKKKAKKHAKQNDWSNYRAHKDGTLTKEGIYSPEQGDIPSTATGYGHDDEDNYQALRRKVPPKADVKMVGEEVYDEVEAFSLAHDSLHTRRRSNSFS